MREIRTSGSEGGGAGNLTGPPYPYIPDAPAGLTFETPSQSGVNARRAPSNVCRNPSRSRSSTSRSMCASASRVAA
jgi:hypothetical protein